MTWILYVLFMSDTREMQFVIEKRFFLTEQSVCDIIKIIVGILTRRHLK